MVVHLGDVRVAQAGSQRSLLPETLQEGAVIGQLGTQHLDGHIMPQPGVMPAVELDEPSFGEAGVDLVLAERLPDEIEHPPTSGGLGSSQGSPSRSMQGPPLCLPLSHSLEGDIELVGRGGILGHIDVVLGYGDVPLSPYDHAVRLPTHQRHR